MHRKWWNLIRIRTIETGAEPGGGEPPQPEPPQSDPQANTGGEGDEKLGEHGMTALENERRANKSLREQLAAANARIKEFEDRDKTDAERPARGSPAWRSPTPAMPRRHCDTRSPSTSNCRRSWRNVCRDPLARSWKPMRTAC